MRRWLLPLLPVLILLTGCACCSQTTKTAIKSPPHSDPAAMQYVLRAATAEASDDLWQAVGLYQLALSVDSASVSIAQALAELYIKLHEPEAAQSVLEKSLVYHPAENKSWEILASSGMLGKRVDLVRRALQGWMTAANGDVESINKISSLYFFIGDRSSAKRVCREAIQKYGAKTSWLDRYSSMLVMDREWVQAVTVMKQIADVDGMNPQRWLDLGDASLAAKDTIGASTYYNKALSIDKDNERGWRALILIASVTRDSLRADSLLTAALKVLPENPMMLAMHSRRLQMQKRYLDAFDAIAKAVAADSENVQYYIDYGFLAHELKRMDVAESAYIKALQIDSVPLILNNYAYLLSTQNRDLKRALDMVTIALTAEPENASFLDTRGWVYFRMQRYSEAIADLKRAAQIDSSNAEIYDHLGDVYRADGNETEARNAWDKAISIDPANDAIMRKLKENTR